MSIQHCFKSKVFNDVGCLERSVTCTRKTTTESRNKIANIFNNGNVVTGTGLYCWFTHYFSHLLCIFSLIHLFSPLNTRPRQSRPWSWNNVYVSKKVPTWMVSIFKIYISCFRCVERHANFYVDLLTRPAMYCDISWVIFRQRKKLCR